MKWGEYWIADICAYFSPEWRKEKQELCVSSSFQFPVPLWMTFTLFCNWCSCTTIYCTFFIIFVFYFKYFSRSRDGRLYTIQTIISILLEYMTKDSILEIDWFSMNMRNVYHYFKYTFSHVFSPVLIMLFHAFFINVLALKLLLRRNTMRLI